MASISTRKTSVRIRLGRRRRVWTDNLAQRRRYTRISTRGRRNHRILGNGIHGLGQLLLNLYALRRRDFIRYNHFQGLLKCAIFTKELFTSRWISNTADELVSKRTVQEFPEIASRRQMSQTGAVNRGGFAFFLKATMESIGFCDLRSFRFKMLL